MGTGIEWCDETWNCVTGCTKISPGCTHCYAEAVAPRTFKGRPFTDVRFHSERLNQPRRWRKPRRVFVNSMSDMFHESLTFDEIDQIFYVMSATPHTYQILTKRHARMLEYVRSRKAGDFYNADSGQPSAWPLPNVWLGVSVENQAMVDERIPVLLDTPAALRFLSVEPLLGPVDISPWLHGYGGLPRASTIDWVIVGGESGPKARPCDLLWIQNVLRGCRAASVPVFVKQLGRRPVVAGDSACTWIVDRKGGKPDEWPEELRVREMPR